MSRSLITCELMVMDYDGFVMDLETYHTFGWICKCGDGLEICWTWNF